MRTPLLVATLLAGCHPSTTTRTPGAVVPTTNESRMSPTLTDLHVPPRVASPSGKSPALVLIHGYGSNEEDLLGIARTLDPRLDLHGLRGTVTLGPDSFAWYPVSFAADGPAHDPVAAERARVQLAGFLQQLREEPSVDASRVYLLGFSQGAILALSLAYTEPALVAGVVAMAGRTLPEVAATVRGKTLTSGPRVLLMHGTQDERLPFANALASEKLLHAAGLVYEFKSYPVGHTIDGRMRDDVAAWLTARLGP